MYALKCLIGTKLKTLRLCTIARHYVVTKIHELSHRYWLLFFVHDQSNICSLPLVLCALRPVLFFFRSVVRCMLQFTVAFSRYPFFDTDLRDAKYTRFDFDKKTQPYPFSCVHFFKTFKYDLSHWAF